MSHRQTVKTLNMASRQGLLSLLLWEDFDLLSPNLDLDIQSRLLLHLFIYYLFSMAHRVFENICPNGLSNTKPVERVLLFVAVFLGCTSTGAHFINEFTTCFCLKNIVRGSYVKNRVSSNYLTLRTSYFLSYI